VRTGRSRRRRQNSGPTPERHQRSQARAARLNDFIQDAQRAVNSLPAPPILIGHSLGGTFVQHLVAANTYPAAVLVASVPGRYPLNTLLRTTAARPGKTLQSVIRDDLLPLVNTVDGARRFLFSPATPEETVRRTQARLTSTAPRIIRELLFTPCPRPRLSTPTLVLAATQDAAFPPRAQRRWARTIEANYLEITGSGHDVPLDHGWQRAADAAIRWLDALKQ